MNSNTFDYIFSISKGNRLNLISFDCINSVHRKKNSPMPLNSGIHAFLLRNSSNEANLDSRFARTTITIEACSLVSVYKAVVRLYCLKNFIWKCQIFQDLMSKKQLLSCNVSQIRINWCEISVTLVHFLQTDVCTCNIFLAFNQWIHACCNSSRTN